MDERVAGESYLNLSRSVMYMLRMLLSNTYGWQDKFKLNKVININPINRGSDMFEILSRFSLFNYIFGPMLKEGTPKAAQSVSRLPAEIRLGLIFCDTWKDKFTRPIVERFKSLPLRADMKETDFSSQMKHIPNTYYNIFNNPEVSNACLQFLESGKF